MNKKTILIILNTLFASASLALALTFNPFLRAASLDVFATLNGLSAILSLTASFTIFAVLGSLISYFSPSFDRLGISFALSALAFFLGLGGIGNLLVRIFLATLLTASLLIFAAKIRDESRQCISFKVHRIFQPPIKTLTTLIFILFCLGFFFPYRSRVEVEGFKAPEVLIDRVVEMVGRTMIDAVVSQIAQTSKLPNKEAVFSEIPEELGEAGLIDTLEKEFGIRIDRVPKSSTDLLGMIKPSLTQKIRLQIEETLSPLTPLAPAIISFLLFLTLLPLATVAAILITPLLSLAFFLLEALELTTQKTETVQTTRPVLR